MSAACTASNGDRWEIYKDGLADWRWRRTASNGKIVGASTEGYTNRSDCIDNAKRHGMSCVPA